MAHPSTSKRTASARPVRQAGQPRPPRAPSKARLADLRPDPSLVRVALTFFVLYAVFFALTWYGTAAGFYKPITEVTATVAGAGMRLVGVQATVTGWDITLASRVLRIDPQCTAVPIITLYASLVLAYPLGVRWKLAALVTSVPVILVANMLRLVATGLASAHLSDEAFFFLHDYLFKVFMTAVVVGLWAIYLAIARRRAT